MNVRRILLPVTTLLLAPAIAFAHPGHPGDSALGAGLLHPLTGWDHLAALLAVGAWSAIQRGRLRVALLAAFLAAMALGSALAPAMPVSATVIEQGIAASLLLIGLLVGSRWRLPGAASVALAAAFAAFHGAAHGLEGPDGAHALTFSAGFLATSAALIGAGFTATTMLAERARTPALRIGGVLLAGGGLLLLG